MSIESRALTDSAGDRIVIESTDNTVALTAYSGGDDIVVGPFTPAALRAAVDAVAPAPVHECPNPSAHEDREDDVTLLRHDLALMERRAEKAEEVADARRAEIVRLSQDRNDWEGNALDAEDRAEKAEQERDEWKDSAIKAMADLERAEQPRPLTPDAIESVLHDILPLSTEHLKADDIANIASDLHAALTEPTRPEGAEKVEAVLHQYWSGDINGDDLADRIAEEMNR